MGSFGATWPVAGIVANRKRLMSTSIQRLASQRVAAAHTMAVQPPDGIGKITSREHRSLGDEAGWSGWPDGLDRVGAGKVHPDQLGPRGQAELGEDLVQV